MTCTGLSDFGVCCQADRVWPEVLQPGGHLRILTRAEVDGYLAGTACHCSSVLEWTAGPLGVWLEVLYASAEHRLLLGYVSDADDEPDPLDIDACAIRTRQLLPIVHPTLRAMYFYQIGDAQGFEAVVLSDTSICEQLRPQSEASGELAQVHAAALSIMARRAAHDALTELLKEQ